MISGMIPCVNVRERLDLLETGGGAGCGGREMARDTGLLTKGRGKEVYIRRSM